MSDDYDDYDDDDIEQDEKPQRTDSEWAELRRTKKERDKAKKELADLKAESAFVKAGLDPDDPKIKYFRAGYEGELTPDAIRAEAIKAGFLQEPTDDPDPQDVAQAQAIAQAAYGAPPEGGLGVDTGALDQAFKEGGTNGMIAYLQQIGVPVNYGQ